MRKHKANHRWQRVNRGRRAEGRVLNAGILHWLARQSPVYRLEIKVASLPVLHVPLSHRPPPPTLPPRNPPGSRRCWQVMARKWVGQAGRQMTTLCFSLATLKSLSPPSVCPFIPAFVFWARRWKSPAGWPWHHMGFSCKKVPYWKSFLETTA